MRIQFFSFLLQDELIRESPSAISIPSASRISNRTFCSVAVSTHPCLVSGGAPIPNNIDSRQMVRINKLLP